jgi:hypothetical protein
MKTHDEYTSCDGFLVAVLLLSPLLLAVFAFGGRDWS